MDESSHKLSFWNYLKKLGWQASPGLPYVLNLPLFVAYW
jgi:hypothetical protein